MCNINDPIDPKSLEPVPEEWKQPSLFWPKFENDEVVEATCDCENPEICEACQ